MFKKLMRKLRDIDIQVVQALLSLVILGLAIAVFVRLEGKQSRENNEPRKAPGLKPTKKEAKAKGKAPTRKAEQKKEAPKKE